MTQTFSYIKVMMSVGVVVFVAALAIAGTGAFFNDTETSTGNVFTAGALDLKVDSVGHVNGLVCYQGAWASETAVQWSENNKQLEEVGNVDAENAAYNEAHPANVPQAGDDCGSTWVETDLGAETFFDFADLKPGDDGENTISLHVYDNDAYACAIIDNMQDDDNGLTEPEEEVGDATGGVGEGELSQELRFFAWDDDGDNIWEEGEVVLFSNTEGPASDVIDGVVYPLFTPQTGVLEATTTHYIGLYWCYGAITVDTNANTLSCDGSEVTNLTQSDSLTADFTFYAEQARNNESFVCPALQVTTLTLAKAVLPPEVALDSDFTLSASGPTPISGVEGDPAVTAAQVNPGVYSLSEVGGPGGETSIAWQCSGNATPETDFGNGTAEVTIAEGENVTCGVTNNYPDAA